MGFVRRSDQVAVGQLPGEPATELQAVQHLVTDREEVRPDVPVPHHHPRQGGTHAGSGTDAELALPAPFPAHVATFRRDVCRVTVEPAGPNALWSDGRPVTTPVVIENADRAFALGAGAGAPRFTVLVRGPRRRVRAYDPARATTRDPRTDVAWYPVEPGWIVPARFEPAAETETVSIVTLQGDVLETPAAGRLRFRLCDDEHTLLATWSGEELFVNLRDAGSGPESYGAGRFLTVAAPVNGATRMDFHHTHHPPCAHSPFATCPLPPLENRLPFVLRAGERTP